MRYLLSILSLLFSVSLWAQPASSVDFGGGVGISSYFGDINQEKPFYNPQISFEGLLRYNINDRYSVRANVMGTGLKAFDKDFENPYQKSRGEEISRGLMEIGAIGEVNFFPYQNPPEWGTSEVTIYGLLGGAYTLSYTSRERNLGIPVFVFGVGCKKALRKRWALELEWAFRKSFTEELDGITDPINSGTESILFNNDWYNVLSVKLTYNIWQIGGKCRTFDKNSDI